MLLASEKQPRGRTVSLIVIVIVLLVTCLVLKIDVSLLSSSPGKSLQEQVKELNQVVDSQQKVIETLWQQKQQPIQQSSSSLPSCQTLMSQPNSPYADGEFMTRVTTPYTWIPRQDGSRQFELSAYCRLKRYAAEEARQCLAGKHLSFIGDSLTRYQYLSLAHFIETGSYPPRFPREEPCKHRTETGKLSCSPLESPNVCAEGDWRQLGNLPRPKEYVDDPWRALHSTIGGGTDDGGPFNGRMECSCARSNKLKCTEGGGTCAAENMLYVSEQTDKRKSVVLSYVGEMGWGNSPRPLLGFEFTDCAFKGTCRHSKEKSAEFIRRAQLNDVDWKEDLADALSTNGILRKLLPPVDVSFYNRGLWGGLEKERAQTLMPLFFDFAGGEKGRCIYRSTTGSKKSPALNKNERGYVRDASMSSGCSFFDVGHMTEDFGNLMFWHPAPKKQNGGKIWASQEWGQVYWDSVHFMPWVYEEINNVLLNMLCNFEKE